MPALPAKHDAADLQRQLRSLLGHEQIVTQAYGRHLLIKRLDDEEPTVVARLTELSRIAIVPPFVATVADGNRCPAQGLSTRWPSSSSRSCSLTCSPIIIKAIYGMLYEIALTFRIPARPRSVLSSLFARSFA